MGMGPPSVQADLSEGISEAFDDPIVYVPAGAVWSSWQLLGNDLSIGPYLQELLALDEASVASLNSLLTGLLADLQAHELTIVEPDDAADGASYYYSIPAYPDAAESLILGFRDKAELIIGNQPAQTLEALLLQDRWTAGNYTRRVGVVQTEQGPRLDYEIGLNGLRRRTRGMERNTFDLQFFSTRFGHLVTEDEYDTP